jgi:hypothetical protein
MVPQSWYRILISLAKPFSHVFQIVPRAGHFLNFLPFLQCIIRHIGCTIPCISVVERHPSSSPQLDSFVKEASGERSRSRVIEAFNQALIDTA